MAYTYDESAEKDNMEWVDVDDGEEWDVLCEDDDGENVGGVTVTLEGA